VKLSELLGEAGILTGFQAGSKDEALAKLVDALVAGGRIPPDRGQTVLEALQARESLASTGMEDGVAFPHASVEGVDRAAAAFGISAGGIPFQSADGQPARLIMLLVIPRRSVQPHIRTLAGMARLLSDGTVREALLRAPTARDALRLIAEQE
jgi:mannitol/fructose-specific phosphotransferase system IIA component (Ntr-type)